MKTAVTARPTRKAPPAPDPNAARELPSPKPEVQVLPPQRRVRPNDRFFTRATGAKKARDAEETARAVAAYDKMAAEPIPPRPRTRPAVRARSAGELALARDVKRGAYEP